MPAIDIIPNGTLVEIIGDRHPMRGVRLFVAGTAQARTIDGPVMYTLSPLPNGEEPIGAIDHHSVQRVRSDDLSGITLLQLKDMVITEVERAFAALIRAEETSR